MKKLLETIAAYCPQDEGEHAVQQAMLRQLRQCPGTILGRDDLAHMTASAFVINRDASRILLLYHNQMDCWAWPGGHADGCPDLLQVALRETWEETGVQAAPVCDGPISLDIFPVAPHEKRGPWRICCRQMTPRRCGSARRKTGRWPGRHRTF